MPTIYKRKPPKKSKPNYRSKSFSATVGESKSGILQKDPPPAVQKLRVLSKTN